MTITITEWTAPINAAMKLRNEARFNGGAAEGKAAALYHFSLVTQGQMSVSEFTEMIDEAFKATTHPSSEKSRDFGRAYLAILDLLITNL